MGIERKPWLATLLQPLDPSAFLEGHWPARAVACHSDLARFPELAEAALLESAQALLSSIPGPVRLWWTDAAGHFRDDEASPATALQAYEANEGTVVIDGLDSGDHFPFLRALMAGLATDLDTPQSALACNAYLSRKGVKTGVHFDQQEVFLLQIQGSKRWRVAPNNEIPFPTVHYNPAAAEVSAELELLGPHPIPPDSATETEHVLERGSVLFLPRGFWHQGDTLTDSLGLTLTFCSMTWADVLLHELRARLLPQPLLRSPAAGFAAPAVPPAARRALSAAISILDSKVDQLVSDDTADVSIDQPSTGASGS